MALTPEQLAQAERLNGAMAWVYPDTSNTSFWDNYFNGPDFSLTQQEQDSGISLGPLPAGAQPTYRARASAQAAPAQLAPITIGPTPDASANYLQGGSGIGAGVPSASTGYGGSPQSVGASGTFDANMNPASYQSNLIQALRSSYTPQAANSGVNTMPNQPGSSSMVNALRQPDMSTQMANNPAMLNIQEYTMPAAQTQSVMQQPQVLPGYNDLMYIPNTGPYSDA